VTSIRPRFAVASDAHCSAANRPDSLRYAYLKVDIEGHALDLRADEEHTTSSEVIRRALEQSLAS
jgi:hypothetical protein